jgi:CBS domain-containing protein
MKKEVISVKPDDPALDALNMLFKMQISGLPVIDAQGKLLGMFTEKNVLAHVLPSYIEKVGRFVYEDDPKSAKKKFMDLGRAKVKELMRSDVVTTTPDAVLSEVDKEGKVVGIVARCDIVGALAREAGISAPAG